MSGPDLGGPAATPGWARAAAAGNAGAGQAKGDRRVALGDLTNFVAGGGAGVRFGAADAVKEVDEASKLKHPVAEIELLKGRLLEEQRRRERAEAELSRLKGVEGRAEELALQLASCTALPKDEPDESSCVNVPQQLAHSEKQALTNLSKAGEATLAKERAESTTEELAAVSKEKDRPSEDLAMLPEQEPTQPRDGDGTSLKDMLLGLHQTGKVQDEGVSELEVNIDHMNEMFTQLLATLNMMSERLSIEGRKVTSLERARDQLRLQVANLESKLGHGAYSISSTEVPHMVNTLAMDGEAKPEVQQTAEWLQAVEELKQADYVKKQPILIEICDDEDTSLWCDGYKKPSNPSSSGEPGGESCQPTGSCEWFFRGNKLMLSSRMRKHLEEICDYVPPEIPFYLYQMNKSNLKRKGNMRLSAKYTSSHLLSFLHKREGCVQFDVDGEDCGTVRVKLLGDGRASLSSGWEGVVEAKSIKVGDICAFHFKASDGKLKLSVHIFHVARYLLVSR